MNQRLSAKAAQARWHATGTAGPEFIGAAPRPTTTGAALKRMADAPRPAGAMK